LAPLANMSGSIRNNYRRSVPVIVIEKGSGVVLALCLTITELRRTSGRLVGVYCPPDLHERQVRMMFALHRQTQPLATRFVFRIVAVFVLTLTCGLASHAAKAQVRIGIGIGGIGGVLLDDSYRRSQQSEQYQRSHGAAESNSTKKSTKARNQKPKKDDSKIAKDSQPKVKPPEPVASAPPTAPLTAGPPPTPDNFGQ